jgi:hypothetical protein
MRRKWPEERNEADDVRGMVRKKEGENGRKWEGKNEAGGAVLRAKEEEG